MFPALKQTRVFLSRFIATCTPTARNIVLSILAAHPNGLRSQEIYAEALSIKVDADPSLNESRASQWPKNVPSPPNPDHPIQSMKYLKRVVLEDLKAQKLVVKFHIPSTTPVEVYVNKKGKLRKQLQRGEWRWKLSDESQYTTGKLPS